MNIVLYEPEMPANTGNIGRTCVATNTKLHLIEPLGFNFSDAHLKRAGLDYHDLAELQIHTDFDAFLTKVAGQRIFAFTGHTENSFAEVSYLPGDVLLFGPEPTGLPASVIAHPRVTSALRLPMMPHLRSLNLANSASIAVYEAWRQNDFAGASKIS